MGGDVSLPESGILFLSTWSLQVTLFCSNKYMVTEVTTPSFPPQRLHRVHPRRADGRDQRAQHRADDRDGDNDRDVAPVHRIGDFVEEVDFGVPDLDAG